MHDFTLERPEQIDQKQLVFEYEANTKFIELAGEINTSMPYYVVEKSAEALNKNKKSNNYLNKSIDFYALLH